MEFVDAILKSTHNSYAGSTVGSIHTQLNDGVRCLELDLHSTGSSIGGSEFILGHLAPGLEVSLGNGNPNSLLLADWLSSINLWIAVHPQAASLILVLDIKSAFMPPSISQLEAILIAVFQNRLVCPTDVAHSWPSTDDLRGKIITIISGNDATRHQCSAFGCSAMFTEWQRHDSWVPSSPFCAASADDIGWLQTQRLTTGAITRGWGFGEQHSHLPLPNWPATNSPYATWYKDLMMRAGALV